MNHTYRLVWNRVQRIWVPVAESARACGKTTRSATSCRPFKPLLLCALALAGAQVQGAPQQGQVPAGKGSATITQSGPASATTTVKQDSQKAVINWHSFNVGAGESVQFVQPNAGAIALNRVTGGQGRSQIDGKLTANGQVFLLNPNGVLFGKGAQVNVGGLVASTFKLSDQDFWDGKDGNYVFTKEPGANPTIGVTNQGSLIAAEGGYVALLAPQVRNESGATISARRGQVLLAAGDSVTLNLGGGSLLGYKIDAATIDTLVAERSRQHPGRRRPGGARCARPQGQRGTCGGQQRRPHRGAHHRPIERHHQAAG